MRPLRLPSLHLRSYCAAIIALESSLLSQFLFAQTADGNNGINQANTMVRGYFDTATQLMYAISAIVAIIGAVRVFQVWNSDHRGEVGKHVAGWFGSCIFLVLVSTIIKSFFGI